MATVPRMSYTCKYVSAFDVEEAAFCQIKDALKRLAARKNEHMANKMALQQCIINLNIAMTSLACSEREVELAKQNLVNVQAHADKMVAQAKANSVSKTNPSNNCDCAHCCALITEDDDDAYDDAEDEMYAEDEDDFSIEFTVSATRNTGKKDRIRKTKRDIMTPEEACKCHKASKNHKLPTKKRTDRDATKMTEARAATKVIRDVVLAAIQDKLM